MRKYVNQSGKWKAQRPRFLRKRRRRRRKRRRRRRRRRRALIAAAQPSGYSRSLPCCIDSGEGREGEREKNLWNEIFTTAIPPPHHNPSLSLSPGFRCLFFSLSFFLILLTRVITYAAGSLLLLLLLFPPISQPWYESLRVGRSRVSLSVM